MIGLLKAFRGIHAGDGAKTDEVLTGLHKAAGAISALRDGSWDLPGDADEKARALGFWAGYCRGLLERQALTAYVAGNRPFASKRHETAFARFVVESQLLLDMPLPEKLDDLLAALNRLPSQDNTAVANAVREGKVIDSRVAHGATMGEIYPLVSDRINALTAIADENEPAAVPNAISELLRILDLYADRTERTFIDDMKNKTLEALPAAMKGMAGAA
jgi:hypothetical protein